MNDFGEFGNVDRRRFTPRYILKLLLFATLLLAIPTAFGGWKKFYLSVLEKQKPSITVNKMPKGIGLLEQELEFELTDTQSGLKDLEVLMLIKSQSGEDRKEVIVTKSYGKKEYKDLIKLKIEKQDYYQDGSKALLKIKARDRSYWKNTRLIEKNLAIDLSSPNITILAKSNNSLSQGDAAFIEYKIDNETKALSSYVLIRDVQYRGFKSLSGTYYAYFPLPLDCFACEIRVEARDFISNATSKKVDLEMSLFEQKDLKINLSEKFLQGYKKYAIGNFKDKNKKEIKYFDSDKLFISSLLTDLDTEQKAKVLFKRPSLNKSWEGEFFYPGGAKGKIDFATKIEYLIKGDSIGSYQSPGVFFKGDTEIRAANSGRVIFSGDFGILGKSIILDHGAGLSSMYSSLSELKKLEGDVVRRGDIIAMSGQTGLFNQKGCMFQLRLHGEPVNPTNWWDKKWVENNIAIDTIN